MPTVFANGRSIVHAGDGQVDIAAPPDVCKTPSPAGPVPIPYVNIAKSSDLADGTKSVTIEGSSVAVESSNLSTSTGDEPGTAGGIISSKNKGKLTWKTSSLDVKFEGKGVVRFGEVTLHNGNTFNTAFIQNGGTGFAYGDDADADCSICEKSLDDHRVLETEDCSAEVNRLIDALTAAHEEYALRAAELDTTIGELTDRRAAVKTITNSIKQTKRLLWEQPGNSELQGRHSALLGEQARCATEFETAGGLQRLKAALQERNGLKPVLRRGSGYMVGILICTSGKEKFAAMSGPDTAGFEDVAEKNGWTLCNGVTTAEEAAGGNKRITGDKAAAFRNKWKDLARAFEKDTKQFNMPGNCAAQKLAVKAKPHKPGKPKGTLSEKWFSPTEPERAVQVRYRGALAHKEFVRQTRVRFKQLAIDESLNAIVETETFSHGDTVPSCGTCQSLLPMLLCDLDSKCC